MKEEKMIVSFVSDNCRFNFDLSQILENRFWKPSLLSVKTPFELLVKLTQAGYSVSEGYLMFGRCITARHGYFYVTGNGHDARYSSLYEAASSFAKIKFEPKKMYRFVYNGGTRSGEKRAVVVDEVHPDHILCRDLNTNDIKNYLFSKITDVEEIK